MIKKILITTIITLAIFLGISHAQGIDSNEAFFYGQTDNQGNEYEIGQDDQNNVTNLEEIIKEEAITENDTSIIYKIRQYFRLTGTDTYDSPTPATDYIKMIINILLGLVSFVALVLIIFAFYLIFFGKGEEAVGKAKKILIGVVIALVVMGLSWFIVSFIFDLYQSPATQNI